ncbi:putative NRAMP family protein [Medicago truncatula]|uniref:Putative NRAMP family protein n=1 Tax=Medicago truncatula TaxID=3880 RepID=A0A396HC18_MEDTR|nr:putative NRAMP family protein [Medicago truncatula]
MIVLVLILNLKTRKTIIETNSPIEKIVEIKDDSNVERDDDDVDSWEIEKSSKSILTNAPSSTSEVPLSFTSISGKSDDGGDGFGSLSKIEGLRRAARRQLAATLYDFEDINMLTYFRHGFIYTNVYGTNST